MIRSIFEDTRSTDYIFEKFHLLLIQHLTPLEVLSLTGFSSKINKLFMECGACMDKICVKVDGIDAVEPENLKYVMKTKRKYRHFRFMCYSNPEFSKYCIEMLDLFAEHMNSIEVYDMVVEVMEPEFLKHLPKLINFKVSSFKGNFQHIFMKPGMRYENLTFENMVSLIDLKEIASYNTVTTTLTLKNSGFKKLESFNFFEGHCTSFIFESNKRSNWDNLCVLLRKYADMNELLITKKKSAGFRLILNQKSSEEPKSMFMKEAEAAEKVKTAAGEDVEMKPVKMDTIVEDQTSLFTRRRLANKTTYDSDDASSVSSKASTSSCKPNEPSADIKATLEVDEFSLLMIRAVSKALPFITTLRIYEVHSSLIAEMFRNFHWLDKVVTVNDEFENEFNSKMFEAASLIDPVVNLPEVLWPLVFQHFDVDDFMASSMVSKKWNEVLGQSENFMDKLTLKMDPHNFRRDHDKVCHNSQRNYKSLDINCRKVNDYSISALELVHVFSTSLVELVLTDVQLDKISSLKDRFIFSQLKSLDLRNANENTSRVLLQNCESLQSFAITGMQFSKKMVERLKKNQKLEALTLTDCKFEYFMSLRTEREHVKKPPKLDNIDLKLKSFSLLFDRVNSWKIQEAEEFKKFMIVFSVSTVEAVTFSGVRQKHMYDFLNKMRAVKKLTIKHFWENDFDSSNFYKIRDSFVFESLTFGMGETYKWREMFPTTTQINLKRQKLMEISEDDKFFKKIFRTSATAMMSKGMFVPKTIPIGFHDPILRIPEKIHELMFQHLSGTDILNSFEVSKTWNNYCKTSEYCARKFVLYVKYAISPESRAVLEKSTRKFANLITDFYQPSMVQCFTNLRKLAITFYVPEKFSAAEAFPNLETLVIQKCPAKLYNPENLLLCFKVFSECSSLSYLEIYEAVTSENYVYFWDLLANNHKLKFLKIHQCSEFFYLFCEDFSHRIHFQLNHLDYRIPQKFSIVGSKFEQNCARFIRKQQSLRIVDLNLCSAVMLNVIFKLPNIEILRMLRITGYDHVMLEKNYTIKEFVFPDTPQFFVLTEQKTLDFKPFFDSIPNVERFYVYSLTSEMLEHAAKNLRNLKYLTCDRFNGFDVERTDKRIKYVGGKEYINRKIKAIRTKFNLVDHHERTFENLFGLENIR